ncbi:MAG TPA: AAA family ATPase [Candidatus Saccharimonadia bacterium]
MVIARIQLVGFKSFATKTTLEFERGMTAVVGPNGSGKSNVADAVRWVLGEQSKGKLRLEDREAVIFAGNSERAKASFAEVTITFDNQDGGFPLDLTEVEISRRLYRNGESEYRLAGRPAKLADIQLALAGAGVSPGGYSVIGQGMIDQLLLASPAERKLLFDEAAGIRAPELSREVAQRKLSATEANLVRLRDILTELEPRLASLEKAVRTAGQQAGLADQVAELRRHVVAARLHQAGAAGQAASHQATAAAASLARLESEQTTLTNQLEALRAARHAVQAGQQAAADEVVRLEAERSAALSSYTQHQTELAAAAGAAQSAAGLSGRLAEVERRLKDAHERAAELVADQKAATATLDRANRAVERAGQDVAAAQRALVALREAHSEGTRDQYLKHALEILKVLAAGLGDRSLAPTEVKLLVHKAGRLLSHAAHREPGGLVAQLQEAQSRLETAMNRRETAVEHQTNVTITQRSLEIDRVHQAEVVDQLTADAESLQAQLAAVDAAGRQHQTLARQVEVDQAALARLDEQLTAARRDLQPSGATDDQLEAETTTATALERCRAALAAAAAAAQAAAEQQAAASAAREAALTLAASWDITPEAAARLKPAPLALAELATALTAAEATLAATSTVQADQLAEYELVKARHAELTGQIADLQQAQADIQAVIAQLDSLIRQRFKANMQALAEQFAAYFDRLLPGGHASLALEATPDGAYGVQIKASPAGKRLTNLAALSGGERTLTGVALLAAILRVNPSPFIILDEVDAALDEANSGRLASILAELAESSQLIVITHNRQTMQAARLLYGITLTAQHASHVMPLRLDEAAAMAAR